MRIDLVGGARPNFVKLAPLVWEIQKRQKQGLEIAFRLIHTHQHWEDNMSGQFFSQLGIPAPDLILDLESRGNDRLGPSIRSAYAQVLRESPPDLVLVVGDVTSTLAAAQAAKAQSIPLVHVEAGLRCRDLSMPEERNRRETDALADHFFTTSPQASQNLIREGKDPSRIHFVGNVMIDSLRKFQDQARKPTLWDAHDLRARSYYLLTIHRAANVDQRDILFSLIDPIVEAAGDLPLVFPVHPRTRKKIGGSMPGHPLIDSEPLPYLEFLYLMQNALGVITDSGGISEETTALGIPCISLREETERPETVFLGTNRLVGRDPNKIQEAMALCRSGEWRRAQVPPLWDGNSASRIISTIMRNGIASAFPS